LGAIQLKYNFKYTNDKNENANIEYNRMLVVSYMKY